MPRGVARTAVDGVYAALAQHSDNYHRRGQELLNTVSWTALLTG